MSAESLKPGSLGRFYCLELYLLFKQNDVLFNILQLQTVLKVLEENGMCDSDNSLEGPPPAPVPSRNASHTSLCSLDLSRSSRMPGELQV